MNMISRKIKFLSNNFLKLSSFNNKSINLAVRIIRTKIYYLLFYIYKKTSLFKLYKKFKLYKSFLNLYNLNFLKDNKMQMNLLYTLLEYYFNLIRGITLDFFNIFFISFNGLFFSYFNLIIWINRINLINSNDFALKNNIDALKHFTYFFHLYKKYCYVVYLWLFSVKYLHFYKVNAVAIPSRMKKFVVLRAPHGYKKAKDSFFIKRIKRNVAYPKFLYSAYNGVTLVGHLVSEQLAIKNKIGI